MARRTMRVGPKQKNVDVTGQDPLYRGHYRVDRYRLRHSLYRGGMGEEISREVLERGSAVGVLPYDPRRDEVVLIEQFRIGPHLRGEEPWMLEIVAGLIEPGERLEDVARRETLEEAGLELQALRQIAAFYSSPGAVTEHITIFCGIVDASAAGGIHGLEDEGEDIRVRTLPAAEVPELFATGMLRNGPVVAALQWLLLNGAGLRAEFSP